MSTDMNAFGTDLTVGYDSHTIGIKTDFQLHSRNHFKLSAAISPSQEPNLNLAVTYEHQRGNNHVSKKFEVS